MEHRRDSGFQLEKELLDKRLAGGKLVAILAVDKNYGIGRNGEMLFWIDEDLHRFKALTIGKNLYMGRLTFESTGPLLQRKMIVLSRHETVGADETIKDKAEFINRLKMDKKGILIGGAATVNSMYDNIDYLYLTEVDKSLPADARIKNPLENGFMLDSESDSIYDEKNDFNYKYVIYKRKDF
ncbi:MAG: dihydrofolate reductase [Ezakiella sp.]|nr:dihydrofolate reductase [Ezakiella sp.]MDD7472402.1 dihydrofolate reductase [Bacillota bacterium]MDY3923136.1 dihydrofolate reductase [Ezakiella sp.]